MSVCVFKKKKKKKKKKRQRVQLSFTIGCRLSLFRAAETNAPLSHFRLGIIFNTGTRSPLSPFPVWIRPENTRRFRFGVWSRKETSESRLP